MTRFLFHPKTSTFLDFSVLIKPKINKLHYNYDSQSMAPGKTVFFLHLLYVVCSVALETVLWLCVVAPLEHISAGCKKHSD